MCAGEWINICQANDTTRFQDDATTETTGQRYYRVLLVP